MTSRSTQRVITITGAFLLGGALLVSTGCRGKNGNLVFWPTGGGDDAAAEETASMAADGDTSMQAPSVDWQSVPAPEDSQTSSRTSEGGDRATDPQDALMRPSGRPIPELPDVTFDFDDDRLRPEVLATLQNNAQWLQENPQVHVVLRGHTDEAGTEEYNISLGQRRAQTVKTYLMEAGIATERLETVSFGEAVPIDTAGTEEAASRNRRVEFFVFRVLP